MGLLRCIVIKASQVLQSGSVAKLILILENKTNEKSKNVKFLLVQLKYISMWSGSLGNTHLGKVSLILH